MGLYFFFCGGGGGGGGGIFGGVCYWKEFCVSKWVWFVNKNSNSPWAFIREGLLSEGYLHLRFGGLIFGRAYFFFGGGVIFGILRYTRSFKMKVIAVDV